MKLLLKSVAGAMKGFHVPSRPYKPPQLDHSHQSKIIQINDIFQVSLVKMSEEISNRARFGLNRPLRTWYQPPTALEERNMVG